MGCILDYKVVFGCVLGVNLVFYGQFEQNVCNWYICIQEIGLYFNYVIVNLFIDCYKFVDEVKDVYIKLEKEMDVGIIVSGVKVVVINFILIYYNMIGFGLVQVMGENLDFVLMFVVLMDVEGVKFILCVLYEMVVGVMGLLFDYLFFSCFDENDVILVMDKVLILWENVLIYCDFDCCCCWMMEGGFVCMYLL